METCCCKLYYIYTMYLYTIQYIVNCTLYIAFTFTWGYLPTLYKGQCQLSTVHSTVYNTNWTLYKNCLKIQHMNTLCTLGNGSCTGTCPPCPQLCDTLHSGQDRLWWQQNLFLAQECGIVRSQIVFCCASLHSLYLP